MGTKNNPGAYDCYASAKPDEPMFVLLGRDPMAPGLVWLWAQLREAREEPAKVKEARECADDMAAYAGSIGKQAIGMDVFAAAALSCLLEEVDILTTENAALRARLNQ